VLDWPLPAARRRRCAQRRNDADGWRWYSAQLALTPLAPGDYVKTRTVTVGGVSSRGQTVK